MEKNDALLVEVTKTYLVTPEQARQALVAAKAQAEQIVYYSRSPDGTETQVQGNEYLNSDGQPDVAAAIADLDDPTGMIGVEEVGAASRTLSPDEVEKLTAGWE
ncbi:MAG: hypothetical protein ACJASC_001955 [Limimaricola cinnabarinus]|jgi:hypothetical protein|uniref:hypothetical protein n=1 Tax=Limimaricola cinnabarinus TaxID=1125964 RepID=UPI0039E3B5EE